jgi:aerobic C4-dicarboxylate transport protein
MGIGRAVSNLIGNCVATVVIAAWEGDIDRVMAMRALNGQVSTEELLAEPVETVPAATPTPTIRPAL